MNTNIIAGLVDEIDPAYIEEYFQMSDGFRPQKPQMRRWVRLMPIAATLAGILLIGVFLMPALRREPPRVPPPVTDCETDDESVPSDTPAHGETSGTADEPADTQTEPNSPTETSPSVIETMNEVTAPRESVPQTEDVSPDESVMESDSSPVTEPAFDVPIETENEYETDHEPIVGSMSLLHYADLLQFGTTGTLNAETYPNADDWASRFAFTPGSFVDFRTVFALPDPSERDWQEKIVIQERDTCEYFVYMTDEGSDQRTLYSVRYTYDTAYEGVDRIYGAWVIPVEHLSEIDEQHHSFLYEHGNVDILYVVEYGQIYSITFICGAYEMRIGFLAGGQTPESLAANFGPTVGGFFTEDLAVAEENIRRFAEKFEAQLYP